METDTTKNLKFDFKSLYLEEKDRVKVVIKTVKPDGTFGQETFEANFLGLRQMETYSPWFCVFAEKQDNKIHVRYFPINELKEIGFDVSAPTINVLAE